MIVFNILRRVPEEEVDHDNPPFNLLYDLSRYTRRRQLRFSLVKPVPHQFVLGTEEEVQSWKQANWGVSEEPMCTINHRIINGISFLTKDAPPFKIVSRIAAQQRMDLVMYSHEWNHPEERTRFQVFSSTRRQRVSHCMWATQSPASVRRVFNELFAVELRRQSNQRGVWPR